MILPVALSVLLLSGCSSSLIGQSPDNSKIANQAEHTNTHVSADTKSTAEVQPAPPAPSAPAAETAPKQEVKQESAPAAPPAPPKPEPVKKQPAEPQPAPATDTTSAPSQKVVRVANDQINFDQLVIEADISDQMIYVKQKGKVVRSMVTSSGLDQIPDNSTPRGEFVVEPERGEWFYASQYKEGAKYWVSFKNHGEFLFHSVVMDANRQIIPSEAGKLGTKASHGCFRLPLEDAKWIYDNIKTGTKVIIHD
jgi:lipoprotein-anchoring transpeptidase ErfK/SrfK